MVCLVLVCISVVASALLVRTVNSTLFNNQGTLQSGSGAPGGQQGLVLQSKLVEQRRAAVAAYAAELSGFRNSTARPIGAVGINLDASEITRRDGVLTGLVLDCIDAVNGYNLAAVGRSPTQLQADGSARTLRVGHRLRARGYERSSVDVAGVSAARRVIMHRR